MALPNSILAVIEELNRNCERKLQSTWPLLDEGKSFCNGTTDKFGGCYNHTLAGETIVIPCPDIFRYPGHVSKECGQNGTWQKAMYDCTYSNEMLNKMQDESHQPIFIFIGGYSTSILFLLVSLCIFFGFRQLRCGRVSVHKNLFLSYVLTGATWIVYYAMVTLHGTVLLENPLWCRVIHIIAQYFTVCNFAWMFCEGLYLHTILLKAFSAGKTLLILCYVVGWAFPAIPTCIYAVTRSIDKTDNVECWIGESTYQWIMYGPIVASLVVNIIFLINIVRLLMTKLRQAPEASQTKKAARATLVLIPLLGLQYLLVPMRPEKGSPLENVYHYFTSAAVSLQGTFVSIIYCFCNGEVMAILRRKWNQHLLMRGKDIRLGGLTATTYTVTDNVPVDHEREITASENNQNLA